MYDARTSTRTTTWYKTDTIQELIRSTHLHLQESDSDKSQPYDHSNCHQLYPIQTKHNEHQITSHDPTPRPQSARTLRLVSLRHKNRIPPPRRHSALHKRLRRTLVRTQGQNPLPLTLRRKRHTRNPLRLNTHSQSPGLQKSNARSECSTECKRPSDRSSHSIAARRQTALLQHQRALGRQFLHHARLCHGQHPLAHARRCRQSRLSW